MLILNRRENEEVVINGNIRVTVVALAGGHVRLGFEAPPEVTINRAEVEAAILRERDRDRTRRRGGTAPEGRDR